MGQFFRGTIITSNAQKNTFWSFWFFVSFVKSRALQRIKPKTPKNYSPKWQRSRNVQGQIQRELLGGG